MLVDAFLLERLDNFLSRGLWGLWRKHIVRAAWQTGALRGWEQTVVRAWRLQVRLGFLQ